MNERAERLGIGLYTAAEASRLLSLPVAKGAGGSEAIGKRVANIRRSGGSNCPSSTGSSALGSSI